MNFPKLQTGELKNKQHHSKVLLNSFPTDGHFPWFHSGSQRARPDCVSIPVGPLTKLRSPMVAASVEPEYQFEGFCDNVGDYVS